MKRLFLVLTALAITSTLFSRPVGEPVASVDSLKTRTRVYQGFSGGMMLHAGYLFDTGHSDYSASGFTKGIGGAVKIHLWKHLRVGTEGYVSTMNLKNDGYIRTFWSGLLLEGWGQYRKVAPYGGLTIGGGSQTDFHLLEGSSGDWIPEGNAVFHKGGFFALDPYIGIEIRVTSRFRLSFKLDWLLAIRNGSLSRPNGPRLYLGFLFGH